MQSITEMNAGRAVTMPDRSQIVSEDKANRASAIDPKNSYIVRAPAGSGKTTLLTQRVLALLATVQEPEEVLAITFTRKAAAEMRRRVLGALQNAADPLFHPDPANSKEIKMHELAQAVLVQDSSRGWSLLQHPTRLRLQTI